MERLGKYQMIIVRRLTKDYTKLEYVSGIKASNSTQPCGSRVFRV